jgi:hypothetical protein
MDVALTESEALRGSQSVSTRVYSKGQALTASRGTPCCSVQRRRRFRLIPEPARPATRTTHGGYAALCRCGRGEPGLGSDVAAVSPVPCRRGKGEPGRGADVAGVRPTFLALSCACTASITSASVFFRRIDRRAAVDFDVADATSI